MAKRKEIKKLKKRGNLIRVLVPLPQQVLEQIESLHPHVDRAHVIRTILIQYCRARIKYISGE